MIRLLVLAVILGLSFLIIKIVMKLMTRNICTNCNGEGYWKGTRGEKNRCKVCNGSGRS